MNIIGSAVSSSYRIDIAHFRPQTKTGEDNSEDRYTKAEEKELQELKEIDRRVRQHEQAHLAAGAGVIVSGAQFAYRRGPDGQLYAVSGEVKIDLSPIPGDPEATADKARQIQRTALAPIDPSPQDRRVAMQAKMMENQAREEASAQESKNNTDNPESLQLHSGLINLLS